MCGLCATAPEAFEILLSTGAPGVSAAAGGPSSIIFAASRRGVGFKFWSGGIFVLWRKWGRNTSLYFPVNFWREVFRPSFFEATAVVSDDARAFLPLSLSKEASHPAPA